MPSARIADEKLNDLKQRVAMWDYLLGRGHRLEYVSGEYKGKCPLPDHRDHSPSFTIFKQADESWNWKCFGCGKSGNIFQLITAIEGCSFPDAVEKVAKMAGEQTSWEQEEQRVTKVFQPMALATKKTVTFPLANMAQPEAKLTETPEAIEWLQKRGISLSTAQQFHVGYVQSAAKVSPSHPWVNDGWLLLPTVVGEVITSLKYRSIRGKRSEDGSTSGFLRAPDTSTTLYNLDEVSPFEDVYVVEGEFDAMIMSQAGYVAVSLPSASYNLSPDERTLLMSAKRIFLAGDTDSVGRAAMTKLWRELQKKTFYIEWENAKDANEYYLQAPETFTMRLHTLRETALGRPLPFVFDLRDSMLHADDVNPMDNPARLFFPWPVIDGWCAILPTDVMAMFASETGMGKTTWLMAILLENALKGKTIVNYSAELSPDQYARRAASYLTGKDRSTLSKYDFHCAAELLKDVKFYNGYQPGAGIKEVLQLIIEAKKHLGADIVAIDHLHFLTRGSKDEVALQADAMKALKEFARDYNVIVIVVGQPRKANTTQRGRIVVTQDAKGSETFGSDASAVFVIHRERVEGNEEGDNPVFSNITKIILDKSRESETATTHLQFVGKKCRFTEMTPQEATAEEQTDL